MLPPGQQPAKSLQRALLAVEILTGLTEVHDTSPAWLKPKEFLCSLALKACTDWSPRWDTQTLSRTARLSSRESLTISEKGQPADYKGSLRR